MMGWREKIIGKENLKPYTHNPHNTQNHQKNGKAYYSADIADIAHNINNQKPGIPPAQPQGLGPEYEKLWAKAWALADWIDDDKSGIPVEVRRDRMPELDTIRAELKQMEDMFHKAESKPYQLKDNLNFPFDLGNMR